MPKLVSYLLQFLIIFALTALFVWFEFTPWVWMFITIVGAVYALLGVKYYFDID